MSYFDLDDILVQGETVTAALSMDAINIGFLDPESQSTDLKESTQLRLPLWLAKTLALRGMVEIEVPEFLTAQFQQNFLAEPPAMNLRERCTSFYKVGQQVSAMLDEGHPLKAEMAKMLLKGLSGRFESILVRSSYWRTSSHSTFTAKMPSLETELFNAKYEAEKDINMWKQGSSGSSKRKRKSRP